jgi:transcriptional regulator with XRE-family HTH domain
MTRLARPIGEHLREWRQRRRMSQLKLACQAEISARHLSFVETGRSLPSRAMILRLAEELEIPPRERNVLFLTAGYAPIFPERTLEDPALEAVRKAVHVVLEGQRPYPALALDRHWNVVASNAAVPELYVGVAKALSEPPINVLRLSLHPEGLAPRIVNLREWRTHLLTRLRRQIDVTADPVLQELMRETSHYPIPPGKPSAGVAEHDYTVALPLKIATKAGVLSFFSTTAVFGSAVDVTLSELAVELFSPADGATVEAVRRLADARHMHASEAAE